MRMEPGVTRPTLLYRRSYASEAHTGLSFEAYLSFQPPNITVGLA